MEKDTSTIHHALGIFLERGLVNREKHHEGDKGEREGREGHRKTMFKKKQTCINELILVFSILE